MTGDSLTEGTTLVTFDVDGTLIRSIGDDANRFHKNAFAYAMRKVWSVDGTIEVIKHHGRTDKQVLIHTLAYYGISELDARAKLDAGVSAMLEYARSHPEEVHKGLEILPGVAVLLAELKRRGEDEVVVGLVTGNLDEIGWMKMSALGIIDSFSQPRFGGFGSDAEERRDLVKVARARAEELFGRPIRLHAHIGDTPADVAAALFGGAHAVGVCTGVFSKDDLLAAAGQHQDQVTVLPDLADAALFLKACQIS